jgi:hypothetical protein
LSGQDHVIFSHPACNGDEFGKAVCFVDAGFPLDFSGQLGAGRTDSISPEPSTLHIMNRENFISDGSDSKQMTKFLCF